MKLLKGSMKLRGPPTCRSLRTKRIVRYTEREKGVIPMADPAVTRAAASSLAAQIFALVRACPTGRVTTYGWIAKAVGYPRGARMVGWIMNESPDGVPAQRVLNSKGQLSGSAAFGRPSRMRELLEADGIAFEPDGHVDLRRFGWDPNRDLNVETLRSLLAAAAAQPAAITSGLLALLNGDPASPLRTGERPPDEPQGEPKQEGGQSNRHCFEREHSHVSVPSVCVVHSMHKILFVVLLLLMRLLLLCSQGNLAPTGNLRRSSPVCNHYRSLSTRHEGIMPPTASRSIPIRP